MRKTWTDERLDDLNGRVEELGRRMDSGFASLRQEMRSENASLRNEMEGLAGRMDRMDERLDSIQRTMFQGAIALTGAILAGFGGMIVLIAAQG